MLAQMTTHFAGYGNLLLALFCVFLNAFFVAAEFAMVKVRSTRLESLQKEGGLVATSAYFIVQNLNDYLSVAQLGITLASLGLGWLGEPAFAALLTPLLESFSLTSYTIHAISFTIAFSLISVLHLVLGELVPKQIAIESAEKVLFLTALPMRAFYWLFYPFLKVLNGLTNLILRKLGISSSHAEGGHTEEEIRLIVEDSYEEGELSPRKASLLENVFEFAHRTAKHIMIPHQEIVYLTLAQSTTENLKTAKESGHTRFPLCNPDLNHVVGLINIKDIVWEIEDEDKLINLYDLKRPVLFVPEDKPIDQLLREFQSKKIHMAIVVNEYGATIGLLSLEDVIEELVGEIQDEFDQEQPKIFKQADESFIVNGAATLREVEQALDLALHHEGQNIVSIGGYFVKELGRLAQEGDEVMIASYRVKATSVKNRRILELLFVKLPPQIEL